jgi:hypothetical protein
MPQLRTYVRIEGELVSHVTEKVDREVELSALLDEVVRNQPISTGRLPANTRFLVRLGERELRARGVGRQFPRRASCPSCPTSVIWTSRRTG